MIQINEPINRLHIETSRDHGIFRLNIEDIIDSLILRKTSGLDEVENLYLKQFLKIWNSIFNILNKKPILSGRLENCKGSSNIN